MGVLYESASCLVPFSLSPDFAYSIEKIGDSPAAEIVALDYHTQRVRGSTTSHLKWLAQARRALALPAFHLRPAFDLLVGSRRRKRKAASASTITLAGRRVAVDKRVWRGAAAAIFIGLFLWGGAASFKNSQVPDPALVAQDGRAESGAGQPAPPLETDGQRLALRANAPAHKSGPLAWVHNTIGKRAAVEMIDNFRGGMESWGSAPRQWAAGWSRSPDGWVRPGKLAIFKPSSGYRDYNLDFFADVAAEGLGWAVRAKDAQNYHAMRFKVIQDGLRPIIGVVHYPVVAGKAGRKTEVPLSAMVHKNQPYRISVHVKGDRVVTSIEGQEVDSWVDGVPETGGVGFFGEANATARLYWMKVAANDDVLGRVCARIVGALDGGSSTAGLMPPAGFGMPTNGETPGSPVALAFMSFAPTSPLRRVR